MFYISSRGHSATGWLAKVLSQHPDIVCFHGTRSFPPYVSGINDMLPENYIEGLVECEKNLRSHKQFGSCHGFYGVSAKPYVEKYNGLFMGIIRNPVKRVNSIFSAYAPAWLTFGELSHDTKIDIYQLVEKKKEAINKRFEKVLAAKNIGDFESGIFGVASRKLNSLKRRINQQQHSSKEKEARAKIAGINQSNFNDEIEKLPNDLLVENLIKVFIRSCIETFKFDSEICTECTNDQIIKMEEMTSSKDYFNKAVFSQIMKSDADAKFLDTVFTETDHVNFHSLDPNMGVKSIFDQWPESFQKHFQEMYASSEAKRIYDEFGYEIS